MAKDLRLAKQKKKIKRDSVKGPKISIIIACYNDGYYIEKAVDSALAQTWLHKEVIVVDDGSDRTTKKILQMLEPRIDQLITQSNQGVSVARNVGVEASSGDYIVILDSDDFFDPEFCEKAVNVLEEHSSNTIVTCFARWFKKNGNSQLYKPRGGDIKNFLASNSAIGNALFRKRDFITCGGYDPLMVKGYEDWEFYIRLLEKGGEAVVIPEVLFHYRDKPNSRNSMANSYRHELCEYIFLKHSELYKTYFEFFIVEWLQSVERLENSHQKVRNSLDYKIGETFLKPIRFFLSFHRKDTSR